MADFFSELAEFHKESNPSALVCRYITFHFPPLHSPPVSCWYITMSPYLFYAFNIWHHFFKILSQGMFFLLILTFHPHLCHSQLTGPHIYITVIMGVHFCHCGLILVQLGLQQCHCDLISVMLGVQLPPWGGEWHYWPCGLASREAPAPPARAWTSHRQGEGGTSHLTQGGGCWGVA